MVNLMIKIFNNEIKSEIIEDIFKSDNDLAKIIVLLECNYDKDKIKGFVKKYIENEKMSWILGYQLYYLGCIDINNLIKFTKIKKQKGFYEQLKKEKFSFYQKK